MPCEALAHRVAPSVVNRVAREGSEARSPRHHQAVAPRRPRPAVIRCKRSSASCTRAAEVEASVSTPLRPGRLGPGSGRLLRRCALPTEGAETSNACPPAGGQEHRIGRALRDMGFKRFHRPTRAGRTRLQNGLALNKRSRPDQAEFGRSSPEDPRRSSCGMSSSRPPPLPSLAAPLVRRPRDFCRPGSKFLPCRVSPAVPAARQPLVRGPGLSRETVAVSR